MRAFAMPKAPESCSRSDAFFRKLQKQERTMKPVGPLKVKAVTAVLTDLKLMIFS